MRATTHQNKGSQQVIEDVSTHLNRKPSDQEQPAYSSNNFGARARTSINGSGADESAPVNNAHSFNFSKICILPKTQALVQPKLAINTPGDKYEQEADAMAEKVMRMPMQSSPKVNAGSGTGWAIQRQCAECEAEEEKDEEQPTLMRKGEGGGGFEASPVLTNQLNASKGGGASLPAGTRHSMEQAFGADFSGVRVHADEQAAHLSSGIQARAFTHGRDIYFNRGAFAPERDEGKRLLAHELTHVVQQGVGVFRKISPTNAKLGVKPEETEVDIPEDTKEPEALDINDPVIIEAFSEINKGLSKKNLTKWIEINIKKGWQVGDPVPDYKIPAISFNDRDELIIEAVEFRGEKGAFNTASKFLPKDVGAKFWWKERFSGNLSQFKLDYASNKAYENLKLHEKNQDVDFEVLRLISGDLSTYREVMQIKAYSDKLLSEALVRLIAGAQARLYPDNLDKQTGILDKQTQTDLGLKFEEQKKAAAEPPTSNEQESHEPGKETVKLEGPIHDRLRKIIKEYEDDIKAPVPQWVKVADKVDSLPFATVDVPVEFLYRISQHFMLGFYKYIETIPEEEIIKKFLHLLNAQFTSGYVWGQIKGIPQGIWNWIKDMAELIWDLIKLPYEINKYIINELPGDVISAYNSAQKASAWFEKNKKVVYKFANEMITGSENNMASMVDSIKEQIYGAVKGMGSSMAAQISEFANKSNEEIGESIGKLQGYILPDILLAVFSEGIGTAIKGAFQSVKTFLQAGKIGTITMEIVKTARAAIAGIEKFLGEAKVFAKEAYAEVKTMLRSIIEYIKKLLGLEEKALDAAKTAKTAETVVEEGKAISKLESKADDILKKDAQKHADEMVENGPEKQSKAKILAKAIVIAEIADIQDLPILAAIAELDLLKILNPKVSFESTGHNPYEIWMIGSKYLVDGHFTSTDNGIGIAKKRSLTSPSKKADELASAKGKSDLELKPDKSSLSPENLRSLENERPVADAFAKNGYEVEFTEGKISSAEREAEGLRPTAEPDLRVEGNLVDIYSPNPHANVDRAIANMFDKVRNPMGAQTRRVAVALDDAQISRIKFADALKKAIRETGDFGMKEIFVVKKGNVYRVYP